MMPCNELGVLWDRVFSGSFSISASGRSTGRSKRWECRRLDFTIRNHRQAIGFASVHIFHRKGEQDYLAFMKQRVPYVRPPNQYAVGNLNGVTLTAYPRL